MFALGGLKASFGLAVSSAVFPAACELFKFRHGGNRWMAEYIAAIEKTIAVQWTFISRNEWIADHANEVHTADVSNVGHGEWSRQVSGESKKISAGRNCVPLCITDGGAFFSHLKQKIQKVKENSSSVSPFTRNSGRPVSSDAQKNGRVWNTCSACPEGPPSFLQPRKFFPAHVRTEHHDSQQTPRGPKSLR